MRPLIVHSQPNNMPKTISNEKVFNLYKKGEMNCVRNQDIYIKTKHTIHLRTYWDKQDLWGGGEKYQLVHLRK